MTEDDLVILICLQRRYLSLVANAQTAYNSGHKEEFQMLLPLAETIQKEIDKRFAKIPKKLIKKAVKSDLQWILRGA